MYRGAAGFSSGRGAFLAIGGGLQAAAPSPNPVDAPGRPAYTGLS